jgi:Ca2+-binding EF-hand superfamily protein
MKAFKSFDLDQSGRIDFKEFCTVLSLLLNAEEVDRTVFIFNLYDLDDD